MIEAHENLKKQHIPSLLFELPQNLVVSFFVEWLNMVDICHLDSAVRVLFFYDIIRAFTFYGQLSGMFKEMEGGISQYSEARINCIQWFHILRKF